MVTIFASSVRSLILFFFGHHSLIRNNTQTAVTNMTIKRILENKIHFVFKMRFIVMFVTAVCVIS